MSEEMVTITKAEYESLLDSDKWLAAYDAAGVDNWEGYDVACQLYYGEISEDDI